MSKASEYVRAYEAWRKQKTRLEAEMEAQQPEMVKYSDVARIKTNGEVEIYGSMSPRVALNLAHWIIETFGEGGA